MKKGLHEKDGMKVLVCDDSASIRKMMTLLVTKWGYEPVQARDGAEAWKILNGPDAPRLALLDWEMPNLTGVQLSRMMKKQAGIRFIYVILVTSRDDDVDFVNGLDAGADDYVTKPIQAEKLRARLGVGVRTLGYHDTLIKRNHELEEALSHVKTLSGLLPICAACKKIRDDTGYWSEVEVYISNNTEADFTHGMCPKCVKEWYGISPQEKEQKQD